MINAEAPALTRIQRRCRRQYLGAVSGRVNADFNKAALRRTGETSVHVSAADCGAPVFSEADPRPRLGIVRAGALAEPGLYRLGFAEQRGAAS